MTQYFRPLVTAAPDRSAHSVPLAGGGLFFDRVQILERGRAPEVIALSDVPNDAMAVLMASRADIAGLSMTAPKLMGVLNVTPDSFSDGGKFDAREDAVAQGLALVKGGADILDIGGESTRPGASFVPADEEIARVVPVIEALRAAGCETPISVDTRKAEVAKAALGAGASLLNDVSALSFDPDMAPLAATSGAPICLMHAQGDPKTMQEQPEYGDVLLDVYDHLAAQVDLAIAAGIARAQIIVDPGIGFGKTLDHNLALLRGLSLFHGLGCAVLLGVSRKRFIGTLSGVEAAEARVMGSVAIGLEGLRQGVQILRVHDIEAHAQALPCWQAVTG